MPTERKVEKYEEMFEKVHAAGAIRHPRTWFSANRAAAEVITDVGLPMEPKYKYLVSKVVLKVLDATERSDD